MYIPVYTYKLIKSQSLNKNNGNIIVFFFFVNDKKRITKFLRS